MNIPGDVGPAPAGGPSAWRPKARPPPLKDVIHTRAMPSTGSALAFRKLVPPQEATLVGRLRANGAAIVVKATLTELGNWVSDTMPNGFNALAGHSLPPHDPRPDPPPSPFPPARRNATARS